MKEGLNSKVKLSLYKVVEFKKNLCGVSDAGSRLMFMFRSGMMRNSVGIGGGRRERSACCVMMNVKL